MKKLLTVFLSLSLVVLLFGCNQSKNKLSETTLNEIDYDTLKKMIDSKEDFILYIGRDDCGTCNTFLELFTPYLEENPRVIYYFSTKALRDAANAKDATQEAIDAYQNIREELSFQWTPTLHHYKDGAIESTFQFLDMNYYEEELEINQKAILDLTWKNFVKWIEAIK